MKSEVGVSPVIGNATFPDDGLTFEALAEFAKSDSEAAQTSGAIHKIGIKSREFGGN